MNTTRPSSTLAILVFVLAGCLSTQDLQPGKGHAVTVQGRPYADVWNAAMKVAAESFEIQDSDQAAGVIRGERATDIKAWREIVGIFITPPGEGAAGYRIEVVTLPHVRGQPTARGWERQTARDIEAQLAGRARW